jgi:hypothetical protein
MLATVRAKNADDPARDAKVSDSEMEAILGVLKGDDQVSASPASSDAPAS